MKLMAIDGNSLANRAFYAVRILTNKDGLPTNAIYGFLNILMKLLEEEKPEQVCVCFDTRAKTFRHLKYDGYKAQRKGMPEELASQMPVLKDVLDKMGIARIEQEGFEADDLLGTLARLSREKGQPCTIVTGDRDSLQFISQGAVVKLVTTRMGQTTYQDYDAEVFGQQYQGLTPDKIVDLKALMGDASDNIPGVPGIGEKTAMKLLVEFGSLEGVYQNLESPSLTKGQRKKLEEGRDSAQLSYELALGVTDAPIPLEWQELNRRPADQQALFQLFSMLEFHSMIKRLDLSPGEGQGESAAQAEFGCQYEPVKDSQGLAALLEAAQRAEAVCCAAPPSLAGLGAVIGEQAWAVWSGDFSPEEYDRFLKEFFGPTVRKAMHDAKGIFTPLLYRGVQPGGLVCDTALGCYLLSPGENGYSLEKCAQTYLGARLLPSQDYAGEQAFSLLSRPEEALAALAQHCRALEALRRQITPRIEQRGMKALLEQVELPLVSVLAQMEREGFGLDCQRLQQFGDGLTGQIDQLTQEIYRLAGEQFNINSTRQLGGILFEKLGLKAVKKTKNGYSTDIEVLEKLRGKHPIIEEIIDYRKLTKLKSTYVDSLISLAADGRIHTTFQQTITATGRLSSTDPNLQNIPVRQQLGAEIRRCFVPRPGWRLIDADYSQIELRVLAHIADDPIMKQAFAQGEDVHTVTASQVFGVPPEFVTPQMRSHAKAVNFGIVYGISAFSLSEDIHVSTKEAQGYISSYLEKYAGVARYMEEIKEKAKKEGYVTTLMGRRRYLPELKSKNFNIRSFGERVALNTPIQGTAADIIKAAMIAVARRLEKEKLQARLLLQVHDELIIEAPPEEVCQVKALLVEEMENAFPLSVRLQADVSEGENWYEAKK